PAGWFHGEHGTRVLISDRNSALPKEACERLSQLANGGRDQFPKWLSPAAAYEQARRDEDLEFVTGHLAGSCRAPHADLSRLT
ncbi:MAG: hypothetical protein L0387_27505, partial [Acidobacteria bacterium]|nr:hypothetical protein [Acidobacteriota bacterium]